MSSDESGPSLAELAAKLLRDADVVSASSVVDERERARHLALLAATVREERARATRRRWTGAVLAIAAVLVAALGLRGMLRGEGAGTRAEASNTAPYGLRVEGTAVAIERIVERRPAESSGTIHAGDRVIAKAGAVAVFVATGTKLTLDEGASIAVVEEGRTQVFALGAGNVRADVAKLHEGERFLIRTGDTEVEVRGTSFRVEHPEAPSPCLPALHTRVVVSEGVVVVRHAGREDRVKAGEAWPPSCAEASTPPENTATPPAAASTARVPVPSPSSAVASASSASSASKLAAANELAARAERASKNGDPRGAVVLFDRLLAEYPSSPIAESATVERMRALAKIDRGRAVAAARDYLTKYPRGWARAEAEAILALGP